MNSPRRVVIELWLAVPLLAMATPAYSMCVPCPCDVCDLRSAGQANWVILDRDRGRITLIPNIHVTGRGEDFALLLPTPSIPEVNSVPDTLWAQAFRLTAAQVYTPRGDFDCSDYTSNFPMSPGAADDGVDIVQQTRVGAFLLTTLQASDPAALVSWLNQHGFTLATEDADKFRPFTDRHWFFCAMQVDPSSSIGSWDVSMDPVAFTFEATQLEVPLGILGINRDMTFRMHFFVVDEHRAALPGFQTMYANRISPTEYAAIRTMYPQLSAYLSSGLFLTRLDRTFGGTDRMAGSILMTRAPDDTEYRQSFRRWVMSGDTLLFGVVLVALSGIWKRHPRPKQR